MDTQWVTKSLGYVSQVLKENSTRTRVAMAFVIFPALLVAIFWEGLCGFFFGIMTVLALWEYLQFRYSKTSADFWIFAVVYCGLGFLIYSALGIHFFARASLAFWIVVLQMLAVYLVMFRKPGNHVENLGELYFFLFGLVYVVGLFSSCALIRQTRFGFEWLFLLYCTVWGSDSAAYLGGKRFGKTPFFNEISSKKTLEGAVTGVIAALVIGFLVATLVFRELGAFQGTVIGGLIGVVGIFGDLFESFIKRAFAVKDSGTLIPGHGGILDRFDSAIFCAPLVYVLQWVYTG